MAEKTETPRRNRLDLNTPAEISIYNSIQEVEKLGAAPILTEVVEMLGKAKGLLSDYTDGGFLHDKNHKLCKTKTISINSINSERVMKTIADLRKEFKQQHKIDAQQFTRHANEITYNPNYVHWIENMVLVFYK